LKNGGKTTVLLTLTNEDYSNTVDVRFVKENATSKINFEKLIVE